MSRRLIANLVSTAAALSFGGGAFLAYYHFLSKPRPFTAEDIWGPFLDWAVIFCAGLTVGIIFFFMTWGHFQKLPDAPPAAKPTEPAQGTAGQ